MHLQGDWREAFIFSCRLRLWLAPSILTVGFLLLAWYDILAFHTLSRLFILIVSISMFAFAWATFAFSRNSFLFFLACGYLWIGSIDLLHTLVYEGMNLSIHEHIDISTHLWAGTRFAEAVLLLVAPVFAGRKLNRFVLVGLVGATITGLTIWVVSGYFHINTSAILHTAGFETYGGWGIIFTLLLALVVLYRCRQSISLEERALVTLAIVFQMFAEMAYATHFSVSNVSNIAAHIFTLFSFWFILQAIVLLNLKRPYLELLSEKKVSAAQLARIKSQDRRLRAIFDSISDGILVIDRHRKITSANHGVEAMFGIAADDLIGRNVSELYACDEKDGEQEASLKGSSAGSADGITHESYLGTGGNTFVGETVESVIKSASGDTSGSIRVIRDVTEKRRLEEQLRRTQKMDAVGQLTGGIAHDFNNILSVVVGNLEILQHMMSSNEKALARVETALRGANRGVDLTAKLLGFSRTGPHETKSIFVNETIENMEDLLAGSLTVEIEIQYRFSDGLWPVKVDRGDLEDVILNLALNARDAMDGPGVLAFEVRNVVFDEGDVDQNPQGETGEYVVLSVKDTGSGMTREVMERATEPFFSTREESKGSGLGLSMVYGFVQRSRGHMRIESSPGNGTTVYIYLPRADAEVKTGTRSHDHIELSGGGETILVVDDEEDLVELAVTHLNRLGYQTITASDAAQALTVLQGEVGIDLLFSDVVMPGGMNGHDLANEAIRTKPDLKVLLTSGFTGKRGQQEYNGSSVDDKWNARLLKKPFSPVELATSVRHTLDGSR